MASRYTPSRSVHTPADLDYRSLFRCIPGLNLVLSPDFVIVEASDERLCATMMRREDIVGRSLFEVFPDNPADPAASARHDLRSSLERVLHERVPEVMAVQRHDIPRPAEAGGEFEERWWSPVNAPVLGPDGEVRFIIHRLEDVTEFIRIARDRLPGDGVDSMATEIYGRARELQEANRQLEAVNADLLVARDQARAAEKRATEILESITDAFYTLDRDWRFTYLNGEAKRVMQPAHGELLGKCVWDEFPEAVGSIFQREFHRAVKEQRTVHFEGYYAPLGIWVSVRAYPSPDGLSVYFLDTTDRKRAETAVRELTRDLEDRDRLLAMAGRIARLGGWMVDLREGVVHWSDEVCAIHEVSPGTKVTLEEGIAFYTPESRPVIQRHFRACAEDGTPFRLELEIISRKGRRVWVRTIGEAIRAADGTITGVRGAFKDITEEKSAAESLRESEERFRTIFERSQIGILFASAEGKVLSANPAFSRILRIEQFEDVHSVVERLTHPDDLPKDFALFQELLAGVRDSYSLEKRFVLDDGSTVWCTLIVTAIRDAAGKPTHTFASLEDITERKQAAAALAESNEKFHQLADNINQIFWVAEVGFTKILYVSPAYETLWGRRREDLIHNPLEWTEAIHPEDRAWVLDAIAGMPADGLDIEHRIVRMGDDVRWVRCRIFPVRNERGEVYRLAGLEEDVTKRKQAETELAAAEAHYRRLVENAPYGIFAIDARGRFTELNPATQGILGRPPETLLGRPLSDMILPDDLPVAQESLRRKLVGDVETGDVEFRVVRPSGERRRVHVRSSAIREDGKIVGVHGIARDITDEVERAKSLRRAERLASVGTLIGGVAHELNNPLHAIRNFAELLRMEERWAEDREALEIIQREADRAAKVVSDLRLIARQTQEGEGAREAVDLNDVVRHVLKIRRYSLETGNVELRDDLAEDLPAVLASRSEIEQVVLNLVVNAEQAMAARKRARRLVLRTRRTTEGAAVHVVDSGPGIPPQDLERIFDPFFTTKTPGEGTGLGLSLVHKIVTEHGGRIQVESEIGKGSAFRIDLPRAPVRDNPPAQTSAVTAPARPLRMLVVDDEDAIRRVSVRFLERMGHRVDTAVDGGEALRRLGQKEYDVILSDLRMPGLDGEEVLQRLREGGKGLERRLIFVTGDAASAQATRMAAEAGVPVLVKPVRLEELARAVEYAVKDRESVPELE